MSEFWYHYLKPKYEGNAKLCHINTDSFIIYLKAEEIYVDIAKDVETRFYTSNYKLGRPLSKGKKK